MAFFGNAFPANRYGNPAPIGVVTNSVEFARIFALPRRALDLTEDVTPLFRKEGGTLSFWPIQSAALIEAAKANGLFGAIGVGFGKTLIALALPEALDSKNTVILVKPDLKQQLHREIDGFYGKHFNLPLDRITIVSYSELSSQRQADILERINPDLIVADECHCLKHRSAARTKRFLRFMKKHPECRFAGLSGTITTRSPKDFAHLIELALRKNSPLPRGYREVNDWAGALAVNPEYVMKPGVLMKFCQGKETVRQGFCRRMVETEGVVATSEEYTGSSLLIRKLKPEIPSAMDEYLDDTRKNWRLGDEEYSDALEHAQALKQLSQGFYYHWVWPNDEPDCEWLEARALWNREVREKLKHSVEGLDSPGLLADAAERYRAWEEAGSPKPRPECTWDSVAWENWRLVKDHPPPPTEPIWIDDFLIDYAILWSKKSDEPGIIWYEWTAVGERLHWKSKFPLYNAGTDAGLATAPTIICSIATQGTGKNLQHRYSRNLFMSLPPNGAIVEQAIGRTHRPGQLADEVTLDWCAHTQELEGAMVKALEDARYQEETMRQRQRILHVPHV